MIDLVSRRPLLALVLSLAAATLPLGLASCGRGSDDPFVGKKPPSIDTTSGTWVNTDSPLSWKGLIGQVVYVQFGFLR
jgi:hypothetical protein